MIVDCHCHLDHPDFDTDRALVIERAKESGVKAIITHGVNPLTNRKALELAEEYDIIKAALGIYPPDQLKREIEELGVGLEHSEFDVDEEIIFIRKNSERIIAIGEIGLDFVGDPDKNLQIEIFKRQIELAKELDLPVVVHTRKAEKEAIEILKESGHDRVVLHCFMGKLNLAKKAASYGWNFSIPTNIVRNMQFQRMVEEIPLSQLLTETDAPYLSPYKEKRRNEPSFISESINVMAKIKGLEVSEMEKQLFLNYQRIFL